MPSVEVNLHDISRLVGKKLSIKEFKEAVLYAKGEVDAVKGNEIIVDVKDTNRPDLFSAEGIAREIRSRLSNDIGVPAYMAKKSSVALFVHKSVLGVRPCIAAAVVKGVRVSEEFLTQIIQLQEKVCLTFGRKRREAAIGLYDWKKLKPPMHYRAFKPNEKSFVPLDFKHEMSLQEILEKHPKGKEYGHLLDGCKHYPILEDSRGVVASMPPIINSELTGRVTEKTGEVLVEVTGFKQETVNTALNVMVSALAERKFDVYGVKVVYPKKSIFTPDLSPKKIAVKLDKIREFAGMNLSCRQVIELLRKARYDVRVKGKTIECLYPCYRQDILHPVDVIEDVLISYGYNNIEPCKMALPTTGYERPETKRLELVRDVCVGLGLQEVLTYTMTSKQKQSSMVLLDEEKERFVEIANPLSENFAVFRKRLFPELLDFLSKNKHYAYPQKIFEVGKILEIDSKSDTRVTEKNTLSIVLCGKGADFNAIKGVLEAITSHLNERHSLKESSYGFLARGRQAAVSIGKKKGFLGELSNKVLQNFGLEHSTVLLEIGL